MRTQFSLAQLADPAITEAERNLRACVHCGICTATCPTYILTGDERDGPRGRIVMIQRLLEGGDEPDADTVLHVDRCLSCLGCRTACPSSVDYAGIAHVGRIYMAHHDIRPWSERLLRAAIAFVMARATVLRVSVGLARLGAPLAVHLPGRWGKMARMAQRLPPAEISRAISPVPHDAARRVALMAGCVQQVVAPGIDLAVTRVLARRGFALTRLEGAGCCGAIAHHMGREDEAKSWARRAIRAFERNDRIDAVLITATGCAAHLMEYPRLFAKEPDWHERAEKFATRVRDFSALLTPRAASSPAKLRVAHHLPCSLQHALRKDGREEADALAAVGHDVLAVPEGHLCCGSAGSYSLLQPDFAQALRSRKLENIASLDADVIAAGNIGCLLHLTGPDAPPVIHPAELIDWAEGGPAPAGLARQKKLFAAQ